MNSKTSALLIVDMINPFSFKHGEELFQQAERITSNIIQLKQHMKKQGSPVLYVNDNYGKWQSDFLNLVDEIKESNAIGAPIAEMLRPEPTDYSVLKPKYSGFFDTPLHLLLEHLEITTLFLTGIVGNMCIQFTANDAYSLEYKLCIPSNAIASFSEQDNQVAMHHFKHILKADISPTQKWLN
ncbi:isochorismatase family cysteine hydrolase [Shouchella patagoniensis]|uniref:isochorismatase family cysteine hydrolase n=1 Tax=Shouchella patagoniensis TaxID=228576 RepID=UPI000995C732|nr:isochorismatase family cysteine hydrolase [Shouchella patagoniensis]